MLTDECTMLMTRLRSCRSQLHIVWLLIYLTAGDSLHWLCSDRLGPLTLMWMRGFRLSIYFSVHWKSLQRTPTTCWPWILTSDNQCSAHVCLCCIFVSCDLFKCEYRTEERDARWGRYVMNGADVDRCKGNEEMHKGRGEKDAGFWIGGQRMRWAQAFMPY